MLFNRLKILFVFIIVLLSVCILLVLNSRTEEPKIPTVPPHQSTPIVEETTLGNIIIIIDDFGYRNDEVSEGFLTLDADITLAVIPGHKNSKLFSEKEHPFIPFLFPFMLLHSLPRQPPRY